MHSNSITEPRKLRVYCRKCGTLFTGYLRRKNQPPKYCSPLCYRAYHRENKTFNAHYFFRRIHKTDTCWLWTGHLNAKGYGVIAYKGKSFLAHRLSWILEHGDIDKGQFACHRCDNPACVNPAHLFLSDQKGNMADMVAKGRSPKMKGTMNGRAKLTPEKAAKLRARYAAGGIGLRRLAADFGISLTQTSRVVKGSHW
jgi:hypothetical protein